MPKVDFGTVMTAYKNCKKATPGTGVSQFWKAVGVTPKQGAKYRQSPRKVLKVRAVTARKIAMLAVAPSEHHHALMKAIEARYVDK